jgi:hypothetical protein
MASGFVALIFVSWALKSTSPLANVSVVVAALREDVVVAVEHRHLLDVRHPGGRLDRHRQHVGFSDRIAEHVVADGRDAIGGIGGAEDDDLRGLGNRIGGLRRVRQRGAEQHQGLVLEDQLLEGVDRLFLLALLVLDHQLYLVAVDAAGGVDLFDGQLEAVADADAVLGRTAGKRFRHADPDVGRLGRGGDAQRGGGCDGKTGNAGHSVGLLHCLCLRAIRRKRLNCKR